MSDSPLQVEVVLALPDEQRLVPLTLVRGATVGDALEAAKELLGTTSQAGLTCGIWGRVCSRSAPLRDGDRVELYRPLRIDPKAARREYARQEREQETPRAKATG